MHINAQAAVRAVLRWLLPVAAAFMVWFAYSQGVTGGLFYDDNRNLSSLSQIESFEDKKIFVLGGDAGPLGRPIALASFLLHAEGWPDTGVDALKLNALIHIVNAALLFWLGYLIVRLSGRTTAVTAYYIAFSAAAIWAVMPLLASTSLITVQRMTSLSALFGLLGLIAYVAAYRFLPRSPLWGTALQLSGLGVATALSVLSKESGALIPLFALIIEGLIARDNVSTRPYRRFRLAVLSLILIAIVTYLIVRWPGLTTVDPFRGFSVLERLLTQAEILWTYLYLAFLPRLTAFGPFHDDVRVATSTFIPIVSILAFLLSTWLAFRLRNKSPWFLFALLWFFAAHLLESTVVLLELYFEHRNYLAVYGFCLALCYHAFTLSPDYRKLAVASLAAYGFVLWGILFMLASIWGNPMEAAENWAKNKPASSRAAMTLSVHYYNELGDPTLSRLVLDRAVQHCPDCLELQMQALLYSCNQSPQEIQNRFAFLYDSAVTARPSPVLLDGIYPLHALIDRGSCKPLELTDVYNLIKALQDNPSFQSGGLAYHLHYLSAWIAYELGDIEQANASLLKAEAMRDVILAVKLRVTMMLDEKRYDDAISFLKSKRDSRNIGDMDVTSWNRQIDALIDWAGQNTKKANDG